MFLKLHYKSSGQPFLVSILAIDGIEINGTMEQGCVLTISTEVKGERAHEVVSETFEQIEEWLRDANLMTNS